MGLLLAQHTTSIKGNNSFYLSLINLLLVFLFPSVSVNGQEDIEYYKMDMRLTLGSNYSYIYDYTPDYNDSKPNGFHQISIENPEGDYGFNVGLSVAYNFFNRLSLQSGVDIMQVSSSYEEQRLIFVDDVGLVREEIGMTQQKTIILQIPLVLKYAVGHKNTWSFGAGLFIRNDGIPTNGMKSFQVTRYWSQVPGGWQQNEPPRGGSLKEISGDFVNSSWGYLLESEFNFKVRKHFFLVGFRFQSDLRKSLFRQNRMVCYIGGIKKFKK